MAAETLLSGKAAPIMEPVVVSLDLAVLFWQINHPLSLVRALLGFRRLTLLRVRPRSPHLDPLQYHLDSQLGDPVLLPRLWLAFAESLVCLAPLVLPKILLVVPLRLVSVRRLLPRTATVTELLQAPAPRDP